MSIIRDLEIKINNSDEVIIIKADENFTFEHPIYSCITMNEGTVRYGGNY